MKTCYKCNRELHNKYFSKSDVTIDGLNNHCKECIGNNIEKKFKSKRHQKIGCTQNEYTIMFNKQKGCCAVCGTHQSELKRALAVDHCHSSRAIRELLCGKCNIGLGYFNDNIELLKKAIKYLRKHQK